MNDQQNFWANDYAHEYIRKNSEFDREGGIDSWRKMLAKAEHIGSVLECGSNIGRNIDFISATLPSATKSIIEVSKPAFEFVTQRHDL
jgi:hypothetical protein